MINIKWTEKSMVSWEHILIINSKCVTSKIQIVSFKIGQAYNLSHFNLQFTLIISRKKDI